MASFLTQFHYHYSQIQDDLDITDPKFNADKAHHHYYTKHNKPMIHGFLEAKLLSKIKELSAKNTVSDFWFAVLNSVCLKYTYLRVLNIM